MLNTAIKTPQKEHKSTLIKIRRISKTSKVKWNKISVPGMRSEIVYIYKT